MKQWGEVLVSAAGPLSNLVLGFVFMGLLVISMQFGVLNSDLLSLAARTNLALCLFNLLPIPPLDGFHIFRRFFPALKALNNSYYGLFALMFLMVSGLGTGLYLVSSLVIELLTGYVVLG
jgi:Zn-dependent protease